MHALLILAITIIAAPLQITSPAFTDNGMIPDKYTCKGENINPELDIKDIPKDAKTLVLIVDDPDAPERTFDHWMMWNIPVSNKIAEGSAPGKEGRNGQKEHKYTGPCPPSGTHHYHFKVYALNKELDLPMDIDKTELLNAMEPHIVAKGELIGLYKK